MIVFVWKCTRKNFLGELPSDPSSHQVTTAKVYTLILPLSPIFPSHSLHPPRYIKSRYVYYTNNNIASQHNSLTCTGFSMLTSQPSNLWCWAMATSWLQNCITFHSSDSRLSEKGQRFIRHSMCVHSQSAITLNIWHNTLIPNLFLTLLVRSISSFELAHATNYWGFVTEFLRSLSNNQNIYVTLRLAQSKGDRTSSIMKSIVLRLLLLAGTLCYTLILLADT